MYGLGACYWTKSQFNSLDFVINRLVMKLFKTNNMNTVKDCQFSFGFDVPSELWIKRVNNLNHKILKCDNTFVAKFSSDSVLFWLYSCLFYRLWLSLTIIANVSSVCHIFC